MDEYTPLAVGPEYEDSGDPTWVEPQLREGYARSGVDLYTSQGRWKERIPPPADQSNANPLGLGRTGLLLAYQRLTKTLDFKPGEELPSEEELRRRTTTAILAVYEALEWAHSLHDHLREMQPKSEWQPSQIDPVNGPYVDGAIGARNASHHGLRTIVGLVDVPMPVYAARGPRWEHSGSYMHPVTQLRWVEKLPLRTEEFADKGRALRFESQIRAYNEHLAARDVRITIGRVFAFFSWTVDGREPPPDLLLSPAAKPPPIDPTSFDAT